MHSLHTHMQTQIQEDIAKVFLVTAVILLCVRLCFPFHSTSFRLKPWSWPLFSLPDSVVCYSHDSFRELHKKAHISWEMAKGPGGSRKGHPICCEWGKSQERPPREGSVWWVPAGAVVYRKRGEAGIPHRGRKEGRSKREIKITRSKGFFIVEGFFFVDHNEEGPAAEALLFLSSGEYLCCGPRPRRPPSAASAKVPDPLCRLLMSTLHRTVSEWNCSEDSIEKKSSFRNCKCVLRVASKMMA